MSPLQAPPRRLHCADRQLARRTLSCTPRVHLREPGCFLDHPVKGGRLHTQSAYHRAAPPEPCGPGCGHLLGIRPHERASSTLSPRPLPPSASTVRRVLPWLGHAARLPFDRRGERDQRCARPMNANHTPTSRTSRFARLPTAFGVAPVISVLGAFHDAPRASAIRSRSLQRVFSSARGVSYSIDYRAAHL
jgi:hypothetical protein